MGYDRLTACLRGQTLALSDPRDPSPVGLDAIKIPRHRRTTPGARWWRHPGTAIFAAGLYRTPPWPPAGPEPGAAPPCPPCQAEKSAKVQGPSMLRPAPDGGFDYEEAGVASSPSAP